MGKYSHGKLHTFNLCVGKMAAGKYRHGKILTGKTSTGKSSPGKHMPNQNFFLPTAKKGKKTCVPIFSIY